RFLTLSLLLVSPIPAAVTRDPYSTIRSLVMVIPLTVIIAYGILKFYVFFTTKIKQQVLVNVLSLGLMSFIFIYSLMKLWSSVIILNEHYRGSEWNYGWEEVADTIKTLDSNLPIIVDNARTEPYSQLLFFL